LPDKSIFNKNAYFDLLQIKNRFRTTSFLLPNLKIILNYMNDEQNESEVFYNQGGIKDFVKYITDDYKNINSNVYHIKGSGTFNETIQVQKNGKLVATEQQKSCDVEIALSWSDNFEIYERSFVNIIATPNGGTHLMGFEQGITKLIKEEISKRRLSNKSKNIKVEKVDILTGLTAIVLVNFNEPQFVGQTKETLGTAEIRPLVSKITYDELYKIFTKRANKSETNEILEKIISEAAARTHAKKTKDVARRKNALENSTLPSKLVDCRSKNINESELFIVEGDSALGTAKLARNSDFQALLPIRGKILNVQKASLSEMLTNAECSSIIQVIGAGSDRSFNLETARYGKIIIMTDADVDGAHIRTLLLTLLYKYLRPLISDGRVYAAVPPLHRIQISKTPEKYIYTYSEEELNETLERLKNNKQKFYEPIQRYKGLGEMDANQLSETTMNIGSRTLRRVNLTDFASNTFELLMGSEVKPRRDFIVSNSAMNIDI
jgi:DNA gyrase subunit B